MNVTYQGILVLLRSAITGEKRTLPEGFDLAAAYTDIRRHQLVPLAYEGAVNCGIPAGDTVMKKLQDGYCQCLMRMTGQIQAVDRVLNAFEQEKIDYMPLKGSNLYKLYPKPELRIMADADILIRQEQREKIVPLMKRLGFREAEESDHELNWESGALYMELHKRLVPTYNKDYYAYFGDGWEKAAHTAGCRYDMSREDEYIYLFTHFAKHYRDGGVGVRQALDLWVYRRANTQLDHGYVENELKKLQLDRFHQNMICLLRWWFEDGTGNETSEFLGEYLFKSGVWGDVQSHYLAQEARIQKNSSSFAAGKLKSILRVIFPSREYAQVTYPILRKWPVLLPGVWVVIWVRTLLFRRDALKRRKQQFTAVTGETLDAYRRSMAFVGMEPETPSNINDPAQ
jgi:hypothetical protein